MTNQEILNNAPSKATHFDSDNHYWHNSSAGYWLCCEDGSTTLNACIGNNIRSLADIRRIVELEQIAKAAISELDDANHSARCYCGHAHCRSCKDYHHVNRVIVALKQRLKGEEL